MAIPINRYMICLQHDETARTMSPVIFATSIEQAIETAKESYGSRWLIYEIWELVYRPGHDQT